MGKEGRPGASLYGWCEFFPNSHIFGADIDDDVLFNTKKIKTFYCDQTNPESIKKMQEVHKLRHASNNIGGWKRKDGGPMKGKTQSKATCLCCKKTIGVNIFWRSHGTKCRELT